MSRLSRQCGILNILQPYRPPWSVTRVALLYGDRNEGHVGHCVDELMQEFRELCIALAHVH
jgi:hypothetical protein